jgi:1-hydroxycarotenoid 3,4-desaturase
VQIGRVAVIGAGIGGLACALHLAAYGLDVVVIERAPAPGGKMREIEIDGRRIDAGPTVFTMRWVFEQLFAVAGADIDQHLQLQRAQLLCRHAWSEDERLDLYADLERSASAIGELAGAAQARRYREFCARARRIFRTLEQPFLRAERPSPVQLVRRAGVQGLADLWRIQPFATLWDALGDYFHDPRLRQLFGRYATYCGSSPFLAPATLMLVAHVEQDGVWLVRGGMHRVATALADLCCARGAQLRCGVEAQEILAASGRVCGVRLASGERVDADAVVVNADPAALAAGLFGAAVAPAVAPVGRARRSLSALTWALVAPTQGFPLARHNVFFSDAYAAEFDDILRRRRLPRSPTVYVCAQDRDEGGGGVASDERLLCLVNAPADGDTGDLDARELTACEAAAFARLERCGLTVRRRPERTVVTTPAHFARLFPATGGALYGQASHGWQASFSRPGARTRVPGLYLAGGAAHPGPGVPMAALSGRLAALALIADVQCAARARSGTRAAR